MAAREPVHLLRRATSILQYVVIATAWNILGGYAGYVNFGTPAFFAIGAYTAVFLIQSMRAPLPVLLLAGGLVAAPARARHRLSHAAPARRLLLDRDAGAVRRAADGRSSTGSTSADRRGLTSSARAARRSAATSTFLFTVMVGLAVIAVLVARFIERSWIGRGLAALRDDEEAAECMGVPTLRLKLVRHHRQRLPARRRRRAVPVLRDLRRPDLRLHPRLSR